MPPTRLKAFRTTVGRCLPGRHAGRSLTWRLATHECDPTHTCRVETIVAWAEAVWDEQLDDADLHKTWRRQQRLVGLKPAWSKVSGPTGAIIMCLRQLGWTWPHHTTFVTASGHEVDLRQICPREVKVQATVDSELALRRVGGQRRTEGAAPVPFVGTCGTGKQTSPTSTARDSFGCDTIRMVHPFCLNCGPAVLGSAQHRLWACRLSRNPHGPSSDSSASGTDCDWRQTQVGERPDARPC